MTKKKHLGPKILILDIETFPILGYFWGLFDQNIALNQIVDDWSIASIAAKWLGEKEVMYKDVRKAKNLRDDRILLTFIWKLLDEADIVVGQNSKKFDIKKINARFKIHGFQPPSSYKQIDTLVMAKKNFAFTSNKLEYTSDKINKKYKKLTHKKFPGMALWTECLKDNIQAWKEMEVYNKFDVLSTEEYYNALIPWDNSINFNLYTDTEETICTCGSTSFSKNGFAYNATGKFPRYKCKSCGSEVKGRINELSKDKRASLKSKV